MGAMTQKLAPTPKESLASLIAKADEAKRAADWYGSPQGIVAETFNLQNLDNASKKLITSIIPDIAKSVSNLAVNVARSVPQIGAGLAIQGTGGTYTPTGTVEKAVLGDRPIPEASTQATNFLRSFPQMGAGAALDIAGQGAMTPTTPAEKFILGDEPVQPLHIQGTDLLTALGFPETTAQKYGGIAGFAMLGLNFVPGGGEGNVIKSLALSEDLAFIKNTLKTINVSDDLIQEYAPLIQVTKDEVQVKSIIDHIAEVQATTKTTAPVGAVGRVVEESKTQAPVPVPTPEDVAGGMSKGRLSEMTTPIESKSNKLASSLEAGRQESPSLTNISGLPISQISTQKILSSNRSNFLQKFDIGYKELVSSPKSILPSYYQVVKDGEPILIGTIKDLSSTVKGTASYRVKSEASILRKMARKQDVPDYKLSSIGDSLASTVLTTPNKFQTVIDNAVKKYGVRPENINDFRDTPTFLGYKAIHLDVELPNGLMSEVQINTLKGMYQKEFAHTFYEKWKDYIDSAQGSLLDDVVKLVPKERRSEFLRDVESSNKIYQGKIPVPKKYINTVNDFVKFTEGKMAQAEKSVSVGIPKPPSTLDYAPIIKYIKDNGGITVDFKGNIKREGYAFSILDKADETRLAVDDNFDSNFINLFNKYKAKYSSNPKANFGGWDDKGEFVADVSYVSNNLKESIYEAILKKQTAVGDLGKYAQGQDGTINISQSIVDSLQPLGGGSFKAGKTTFRNWEEVRNYYSAQNYTNAPKIESEILSALGRENVIKPPVPVPHPDPFADFRRERGFTTSVKEQFPDMQFVAGQYIPRSTDRLAQKAANLVRSDIITATNMALQGTDDASVAVASELIKYYGEEAGTATDVAVKELMNEKAAMIANEKARQLTEMGRSVQAASIIGRMTPEGQLQFAAREIQRYNAEVAKTQGGLLGLKKQIPELTPQQADTILKEMNFIKNMPDGSEKSVRFMKLQNYIQDLVPSSLMSKIIAVWKAGLLTGIKTSGLNIFSNVTHFTAEGIKDIPAAAVDSVASLFTRERTLMPTIKGVPGGVKEGFDRGIQYIKTGYDERNIGTRLDWKRVSFGKSIGGRALQRYEETVFHVIGAEDQPFYYGAKARSLYDQALAMAQNKGMRGPEARQAAAKLVENPTDKMLGYAVKDAEIAVFQNQTMLGKAAKAIQNVPVVGQILLPFGRTPSSVAMQIINYSPIGVVKTIAENVGRGKFDQRLFSQGMGRAITGTAVLWLGGELYKNGLIALDRPTGEREQKLWELEGKVANSIKVNGEWRTAQTLGPMGNLLIIGGHFKDAFSKTGSPTAAITTALAGSGKTFTEQTFLQGINAAVDALNDPATYAEGWLASTLSSTIPTIISDVARAMDAKERRSPTVPERAIARIPGWRQTLEPQVTVLGKERARVGNILEVMLDPSRPSKEITTPLIQEFQRLDDKNVKVSPTLLGDKKGYLSLTPAENTQLWKRAGQITESKLSNLIRMEEYRDMPDDEKGKTMTKIIDQAKVVARAEAVLQKTQGLEGDALKAELSKQKQSGLMTREVYAKYLELR